MHTSTNRYKPHRFPVDIISHAVWRYVRFCLSSREVEELLFVRGVVVTYEAIRKRCRTFGQPSANHLQRQQPRPGDTWHMAEVCLTIHSERQYLWRAVDQDGTVLDILVPRRRDQKAAKTFFRKLLKDLTSVPRVLVTAKLKSYRAAKREILPGVEHRQHALSTTAPRARTSPPASGSGSCSASNRRVMHHDFSAPMVRSPNPFVRAGICSLPS